MSDSESNEKSPLLNKISERDALKSPQEVSRKYIEPSSTSVRDPYIINTHILPRNASLEDLRNSAQYNRYRYYSKIHGNAPLVIPDHVLPRNLFWPHRGGKGDKQSSFITIFAIWNTMMGTSLLSLPWAMQQSGFALGIILIVVMAIICLYTCLLIVKSADNMEKKGSVEFVDVCEKELGYSAKYTAFIFGLVAFLGAIVVYWVLMSNFLFKVGKFVHDHASSIPVNKTELFLAKNSHGVICLSHIPHTNSTVPHTISASSVFFKYWNQRETVPFYLLILLLPLSSLKSPTFFTKFNALGTISVLYILVFVSVKSAQWGPHLHFNVPMYKAPSKLFNMGFPALTGILALALYIHNAILSILATNEKPQNNTRDVGIAYSLTTLTYFFVAVMFYTCFPMDKDCIEQVFLDNFVSSDVMTFIAQCGLLFQMTTVFPLLMYIVRVQVLNAILKTNTFSYLSIFLLNICVIPVGVLMAVFYPKVGHIIRYVGSASGMVYIFTLPSLVLMVTNYKRKTNVGTWKSRISNIFHATLIIIGILNFVAQFLVSE